MILKEELDLNLDLEALESIDSYYKIVKETKNLLDGNVINIEEYAYDDEQDAIMHYENLKNEIKEEKENSNLSLVKVNIIRDIEELNFFIPGSEDEEDDYSLYDDNIGD